MRKKYFFDSKKKMVIVYQDDKIIEAYLYNKSMKTSFGLIVSAPTGKMTLIPTITTSMLENDNCLKNREIKGSICEKCYSKETLTGYRGKNTQAAYKVNSDILSQRLLTEDEIQEIVLILRLQAGEKKYIRFESHGDLINETHLRNYFAICQAAPDLHFALWTKMYKLLLTCCRSGNMVKPENINIVVSSLFINKPIKINCPWIDIIFTVYDFNYIIANNVKINCAMKHCYFCGMCYEKHSETVYINECVKSDQNDLYNYALSCMAMSAEKPSQKLKELKTLYKDNKIAAIEKWQTM